MDIETIFKLSEQVKYDLELGISVEIRNFLEREESVQEFKISNKDRMFEITVKLTEYSSLKAKQEFLYLVSFIEYTLTCYVRKVQKDMTEYYLLSSSDSNTGFFCHLVFK